MHKAKKRVKWNLEKLKDSFSEMQFRVGTESLLKELKDQRTADNVETKWADFKTAVTLTAAETIGLEDKKAARKPWVTHGLLRK